MKPADGGDAASANFNQFFDLLGPAFRCGLAHEYYVKKSCTIAMLDGTADPGLGVDAAGHYWVVVESCRDLKKAFDDLQVHLYGP